MQKEDKRFSHGGDGLRKPLRTAKELLKGRTRSFVVDARKLLEEEDWEIEREREEASGMSGSIQRERKSFRKMEIQEVFFLGGETIVGGSGNDSMSGSIQRERKSFRRMEIQEVFVG